MTFPPFFQVRVLPCWTVRGAGRLKTPLPLRGGNTPRVPLFLSLPWLGHVPSPVSISLGFPRPYHRKELLNVEDPSRADSPTRSSQAPFSYTHPYPADFAPFSRRDVFYPLSSSRIYDPGTIKEIFAPWYPLYPLPHFPGFLLNALSPSVGVNRPWVIPTDIPFGGGKPST